MKKISILLFGSVIALTARAQLPKWVVNPVNDTLFVKVDGNIIEGITEGKSSLWTMDGTFLYTTGDHVLPYKDGVAAIQPDGQPVITGFIDGAGKFTGLPNPAIAYDNPYFEDGHILCVDNGKLSFFKKDGTMAAFPEVEKVYPFHRGFAPYFTYGQLSKKKDPHYGYFRADGQEMEYVVSENGTTKRIEPKELDFVSGIGANGKGVAVIKNKIYWFDAGSGMFEPFLWGEDEPIKKRHLKVAGDYERYFIDLPSDTIVIHAKYGKNRSAKLIFDGHVRPVLFSFEGDEMRFVEEPPEEIAYASDLEAYGQEGHLGLSLKSREVLPPQFEEVGIRYGNRAFVKIDGKWGVIEILPSLDYAVKLNKDEDIAFRHQKFETQLRLDLPAQISAKEARVDVPEETGCVIDKTSRVSKDTDSGNFVTYDCVLNIPASLPDTITTLTYAPVKVSYDGLTLFGKPMTVKAWHLKYYNVDPIDSETSISAGVLSFTVNINAQRNVGEGDYPFEVRIEADSVIVEQEKLSETRRKFLVSNLQEGPNNFNIYVTEVGCPSSVFPFEIYYTRPRKKQEKVVIRKKPRLELEL